MKWTVKSHKRVLSHLTLTSVFIIVLNLVASSGNAKVSTPLLEYLKMKRSSRGRPISAVSSDGKTKVSNYLHLHLHHNGFPLHRYEQLEITAVKKVQTPETWKDRGLRGLV